MLIPPLHGVDVAAAYVGPAAMAAAKQVQHPQQHSHRQATASSNRRNAVAAMPAVKRRRIAAKGDERLTPALFEASAAAPAAPVDAAFETPNLPLNVSDLIDEMLEQAPNLQTI